MLWIWYRLCKIVYHIWIQLLGIDTNVRDWYECYEFDISWELIVYLIWIQMSGIDTNVRDWYKCYEFDIGCVRLFITSGYILIHPFQRSYQAYHDIRIQVSRSDKQSNPTYIKLITFVSILFNICIKPSMTFVTN